MSMKLTRNWRGICLVLMFLHLAVVRGKLQTHRLPQTQTVPVLHYNTTTSQVSKPFIEYISSLILQLNQHPCSNRPLYRIKSGLTGDILDTNRDSKIGTEVFLHPTNTPPTESQLWCFIKYGDSYRIVLKKPQECGWWFGGCNTAVLDIKEPRTLEGAPVITLHDYSNPPPRSQLWKMETQFECGPIQTAMSRQYFLTATEDKVVIQRLGSDGAMENQLWEHEQVTSTL